MPFINISNDPDQPHRIDVSDITGVKFDTGRGEEGVCISVYNSEEEILENVDLKAWDIDADSLIKKLHDAGLVRFPMRKPPAYKAYDHYINPEAVAFMAVSKVTEDGLHQGIIFGVRGIGQKKSSGNSPEEVEKFLAAVRAAKTMREYKPEDVCARNCWYEAGGLYIDAKVVTRIDDQSRGYMEISFDGSPSLDVEVKLPDFDVNHILAEIERTTPDRDIRHEGLSAIFDEAQRRKDEADRLRTAFSNELAAANGGLVAMPCPDVATHIRRADIKSTRVIADSHDGEITLCIGLRKKAAGRHSDSLYVKFENVKDAKNAAEVLTPDKAPTPAPRHGARPSAFPDRR